MPGTFSAKAQASITGLNGLSAEHVSGTEGLLLEAQV